MTITDALILPPDVEIVPASRLGASVRAHTDIGDDEYAVTRPYGRVSSKVLTSHSARLLGRFRTASTIVDAVASHATAIGVDAPQLLTDTYALLRDCFNARLLVEADSPEAGRILPSLVTGKRLDYYTVVRDVQVLSDTEVYLARSDHGKPVALKIVRAGAHPHADHRIAREARILEHLAGATAPALLGRGDYAGRPYLAMEWCSGVQAGVAFAEVRESTTTDRQRLHALAVTLATAYATLHAHGVIHGDVHPNNLLVGRDGEVTILDFGLSGFTGLGPPERRGGIAYFYEPEYARAALDGTAPPSATAASDQYAVAALLYLLLTGDHHVTFSLEREPMLRQIADAPPVPFSRRGVAPWPAVESAIHRALRKDPADRFPSVADFAKALRHAPAAAPETPKVAGGGTPFVAGLLRDLETCDARVATLPSPNSSIMFGGGGVAYLWYRLALLRDDSESLAWADRWLTACEHEASSPLAFWDDQGRITEAHVGRLAPMHSRTGLLCLRTLLAQAQGDLPAMEASAIACADLGLPPPTRLDATTGLAGVLLGYTLMYEAMPLGAKGGRDRLRQSATAALAQLAATLRSYPDIAACTAFPTLGIAHGWAGVLYVMMRWCQTSGTPIPDGVPRRLAELAALGEPVARGQRWPIGIHDPRFDPGWCNGSAGFVHLWTLAHRSLAADRYAELAELAAWHAWEDPDPNPNLCCGLAGRAYGLIAFANHAGGAEWVARAADLAERSVDLFDRFATNQPRPLSLYKGRSGTALLLAELERPHHAAMPFFAHEGWPATV